MRPLVIARLLIAFVLPFPVFAQGDHRAHQSGAGRDDAARLTTDSLPLTKKRVVYPSGDLMLVGFLFKPAGVGPFPTIVWNHGSEPNPGGGAQFDSVASIFVPHGYVVFAPTRRGHGESNGAYITDVVKRTRSSAGDSAAFAVMTHLLETEQLDDQIAGLTYLKTLPFVDAKRLGVAGCSFGGIQTLLGAERGLGYRAAMPISPAALNWDHNAALRARVLQAVAQIDIPVLLLQPPRDASLGPSRDLGAEFARLHKPYRGIVYPDTIPAPMQVHCFGGSQGDHIWARDAVAFFDSVLKR